MNRASKRFTALFLTLALALALLAPVSSLGEDGVLRGIYEKLIAEGTDYYYAKQAYEEYFEGVTMTDACDGESVTITLESSVDFVDSGSWTVRQEGDYLTLEVAGGDLTGMSVFMYFLDAAADYWGVNKALANAYVIGTDALNLETPNFRREIDEAAGTVKLYLYIAGPFDMKELDQMAVTEEILKDEFFVEPMGEEPVVRFASFGRITLAVDAEPGKAKMLLCEYGGLDSMGAEAARAMAKAMELPGWEEFTAAWTDPADAEAETYRVKVNVTREEAAAAGIITDPPEGYAYALLYFGSAE